MLERIRVFSGNANVALAQKISENLGVSLGKAHVTAFSDGETRVEINENVRGMDVFIIQPTCPPVNITLLEGEYKELKALADATTMSVSAPWPLTMRPPLVNRTVTSPCESVPLVILFTE